MRSIINFRNTMAHEFGDVLGIGSLWGEQGRSFVNRATGTDNPTTYAGWAYGELSNTFGQTAVPLTTGVGGGSDYSHWQEEIFNAELMTHEVEQAETPTPLSQLTIASLRDMVGMLTMGQRNRILCLHESCRQLVLKQLP